LFLTTGAWLGAAAVDGEADAGDARSGVSMMTDQRVVGERNVRIFPSGILPGWKTRAIFLRQDTLNSRKEAPRVPFPSVCGRLIGSGDERLLIAAIFAELQPLLSDICLSAGLRDALPADLLQLLPAPMQLVRWRLI
jgi:hypothetical protein